MGFDFPADAYSVAEGKPKYSQKKDKLNMSICKRY